MNRFRRHSGLPGIAIAVAVHAVLLGFLFAADPPRQMAREIRRPPVKVRLAAREVERPPEPVVPPPAPIPEPAATAPKQLARQVDRVAQPPPAPSPPKVAPPPVQAEPRPEPQSAPPPPPRRFAVAMEAVSSAGGVAVPVSNEGGTWAFGTPDGAASGDRVVRRTVPDGNAVSTTSGDGEPVRPVVEQLPRLIGQPDGARMRAEYPEAARREGIEANVNLKILIGIDGRVAEVRLVRPAGNGFDEAAERLVREFRFEPGRRDGRPVAMWIPWLYKFRLDG